MTGLARRLFLLQHGAERVPRSLSLRGGSDLLGWEPLVGVVVETDEGWVLFDTGASRAALDDPAVERMYRSGGEGGPDAPLLHPEPPDPSAWTWGHAGDPLVASLASVGLALGDLSLAVVSHLHLDHAGGVPLLAAAGVPVALQRAELAFARSGRATVDGGFHPPDWEVPDDAWRLLDGDADLAPGVSVVSTPGHTPGHCSLRVDLPETGTWLFAADAADLGQNLLDGVPCGSCAGGSADDERAAEASLERLLGLARETRARLVPGHDQLVWNAVAHPPGGHR